MAEFKLGRIRFAWKNNWASTTTYYKDDVIAYGGKMYLCVVGHTSASDFFTDLDVSPSKWNLVSDGQTWKGDWTTGTYYVYNDIVAYGARLYICQTVHTSAADSTTHRRLPSRLTSEQIRQMGSSAKFWHLEHFRISDIVLIKRSPRLAPPFLFLCNKWSTIR